MKKIVLLTSSRADYGIYLPLIKAINESVELQLEIVAFGTHLSEKHGYTLNNIIEDGLKVHHLIDIEISGDNPEDISKCYATTVSKFANFWMQNGKKYDWIIVLGDRFEMAAAVAAGIPFVLPFVHLYGGETTLGAIDNIYRHFITLASKLHFVSLEEFYIKVKEIAGKDANCFVVGALGLDNLNDIQTLSIQQFNDKWKIDLRKKSILITIHPETINYINNIRFSEIISETILDLAINYQLIITMPNADTSGNIYRDIYKKVAELFPNKIHLIENFGTESYFTAMQHVGLMLGNTSSGIMEAASFGKYVLNIGNRQKGRIAGNNVIHLPFDKNQIVSHVNLYFGKDFNEKNIYFKGGASKKIVIELIKNE